jgi:hypothetical protein
MSIRQTRREFTQQMVRARAPKVSTFEFMARVKRLIKRRMVADGVIEPKTETKPSWEFYFRKDDGEYAQGKVGANTRGEARAAIKQLTGCKRLPADIIIEKVNADSTGSARAA